ncbi:MAG: sodium:solute symporter family protein [Alphaproteobacteria bacterium]|nr:sodium:solute symporter family protein [Alphaproteobacteria bacterium]
MAVEILYIVLPLSYIAFVLGIGWIAGRNESREDYLIGSRRYAWWAIAMSLGTSWANAGWFLLTYGYLQGDFWGLMVITISYMTSFLVFAYFAPRLRNIAIEKNTYTLADTTSAVFGKPTGLMAAVTVIVCYMGWFLMELVAGAKVISGFSGWSYEITVLALAGIIGFYLWIGGFRALMRTDIAQFAFLGIMFFMLFLLSKDAQPVQLSYMMESQKLTLSSLVVNIFGGICVTLAAAEIWQRIMAARSDKDARRGVASTVIISFFVLVGLPIFLGAFMLTQNPDLSADQYIATLASDYLPSWFGPFLFVAFLALIMSTLDTAGFITAQAIVNDGVMAILGKQSEHPRKSLKWGIMAVFGGSAVLALMFRDVMDILYFLFAYWAILTPTLWVFITDKRPTGAAVFWPMLIGFIALTALQVTGYYKDYMNGIFFTALLIAPWVIDKILKTTKGTKITKEEKLNV